MMKVQVFILCCVVFGVNANRQRLTNNEIATAGEFPYQVSLQIGGQHNCGGALISDKHILTAAHCVYDIILGRMPIERMKVSVGSNNVMTGTKMDLKKVAIHPRFIRETVNNDVAVLTLKTPITESATVKPIALPTGEVTLTTQSKLIVSGFGSSFSGGPTSPILKKMTMTVISRAQCQQFWTQLNMSHMCAVTTLGHGTCGGDSGGPLTLDKKVVVGVVSGGNPSGCGKGGGDLFTKVSAVLDFVKGEMAKP